MSSVHPPVSKMEKIDPGEYGLSSRTDLRRITDSHLVIVKDRKSRIVMKDGRQIMDTIGAIRSIDRGMSVSLATSAPVCSKTRAFLEEEGIEIIPMD